MEENRIEFVMGRIEWLRDLRRIFNSESEDPQKASIKKPQLLRSLSKSLHSLSLTPLSAYTKRSKIQCYSYQQVYNTVYQYSTPIIQWDDLIDRLIQTYRQPKTQSENSTQAEQENQILNFAFSQPKLAKIPENLPTSNLTTLCLTGNALTHTDWEFPKSLQILNLSRNRIQTVKLTALPLLKFLNLFSNKICQVQKLECRDLQELYLGFNEISSLRNLSVLSNLRLLDLAYNEISSIEDLACIERLKNLSILQLKGNPLQIEYSTVKSLVLPQIQKLNPPSIKGVSAFNDAQHLSFLPMKLTKKPTEGSTQSSFKSSVDLELRNPENRGFQSPSVVLPLKLEHLEVESQTEKHSQQRMSTPSLGGSKQKFMSFDFDNWNTLINKAETRLNRVSTPRARISKIDQKSIDFNEESGYGNPTKALMIGPPATSRPSRKSLMVSQNRSLVRVKPRMKLSHK